MSLKNIHKNLCTFVEFFYGIVFVVETALKDDKLRILKWLELPNVCGKTKMSSLICAPMRDLVPVLEFKKREKHPWMSVNFGRLKPATLTKSNTLPWVFFTSFKLCK